MGKQKTFHLLRTSLIILIICAVAGLTLTGVLFFRNPDPTYASATLELSFDGAAQGRMPNGARYNVQEMTSDGILTQALEKSGMTGTYTVEQIRDNLVIAGVYPEDLAEQAVSYDSLLDFTASRQLNVGDYYPTTFDVKLKNGFDTSVSRGKLEELLKNIVTAYQALFIQQGSTVLNAENPILPTLDEYDFPQQLQILENHLSWVADSANEMYKQDPTFRYNGVGFNDISIQLNNLTTSNITQLNAEITSNGLTKDAARLLTQYQVEVRELNIQLEKQNTRLKELDKLIKAYEKNEVVYLVTGENLTKIDTFSVTYDQLVKEQQTVTDLIAEIKSRMNAYTLRINNLTGKTAENKDTAVAEEAEAAGESAQPAKEPNQQLLEAQQKNIDAVKGKAEAVIGQYKEMLAAYNAEKLNEMSVAITKYKYETPRVLSGKFAIEAIKTAGPICLIGLLAVMLMAFIVKRKKMRAEEA